MPVDDNVYFSEYIYVCVCFISMAMLRSLSQFPCNFSLLVGVFNIQLNLVCDLVLMYVYILKCCVV